MTDTTGSNTAATEGWDGHNVIAVSFEDDRKAYNALTSLKELDTQERIRVLEAVADDARERARTHRSDRYRSDLSGDPPSAAAAAQETRRVLPGSCKARARRAFAPQSPTPGKGHLSFPAFSHVLQSAAKVAHLQENLMARPGLEPGTPRFSVVCSTN